METVSQAIAAAHVFFNLYGFLQLATRTGLEEGEPLSPLWSSLYEIIVRRQVALLGSAGPPLGDRKARIGWVSLVIGFLLQFVGTALLPVVRGIAALWALLQR
jgi:hypothetical protein